MDEHQIRLRGGWECRPAGAPDSPLWRLSLPTRWPQDGPRGFHLVRRFGRPPLGADQTSLFLKLDEVPGLRRLLLNDRRLVDCAPDRSSYEIPIDELIDRNILILEIELPDPVGDAACLAAEWGFVSLLIRPIGRQTSSPGPIR